MSRFATSMEIEGKLVPENNTQFKMLFNDIDDSFIEKIKLILKYGSFDLIVTEEKILNIVDTYYDDSRFTAKNKGWSIRHRKTDNKNEITIKIPEDIRETKMTRVENNLSIMESENPLDKLKEMFCHLPENHDFDLNNLQHYLILHNKRTSLMTDKSVEISLDKYYYEKALDRSEVFYQLEIELNNSKYSQDKYNDLQNFIRTIFKMKSVNTSKYFDAFQWANDHMPFKHAYGLMMDIAGYTQNSIDDQKQMVQNFTEITQTAINSGGIHIEHSSIIPTGDGMCLLFFQPLLPLQFIKNFYIEFKNFFKWNPRQKIFSIRTGVTANNIVPYWDITGKNNWAGKAINDAERARSQAEKDEVLVTDEYYLEVYNLKNEYSGVFSAVKEYTVKHDVKMMLRQFRYGA